jgi:hypothetical protein
MSEEQQEQSGGGSIKNIIIGLVSTVTLGIGGFITNKLTGGDDKEATPAAAAAPVINITNSNQQQQSAGGTKVIERVVEKPAAQPKPAPAKKKDGDEFKETAPQW